MKNEQSTVPAECVSDSSLTDVTGGYVIVNNAGCYELYSEDGRYVRTFRGNQLDQLRKYASQHGLSDEFRAPV